MEHVRSFGGMRRIRDIRERTDVIARQYQLDRALRRVLSAPEALSRNAIAELYALWGTPLGQADESYLATVTSHAQSCAGHVLQCGVSLTTLLLGALTADRTPAKHVWCLTHDAHWANVIRSWMTQYRIANTHVIVARPKLFDDFVWYNVDPSNLPENFGLVLSEGGAAQAGGITGLLAQMQTRFAPNTVILPRFVHGAQDQQRLLAWSKQHGMQGILLDKKDAFFKISSKTAAAAPPAVDA